MNHYVKAIIILTLATSLSAADTQSKSRKELVDGFRASQVCYEEAVSSKNWAQGLICASSSLNSGIEIFGQEHRNIAALTHNDGLMLMKVRDYKASKQQLIKALKLYERLESSGSQNVVTILLDLANLAVVRQNPKAAQEFYDRFFALLATEPYYQPLQYAKYSLTASIELSVLALDRKGRSSAITYAEKAYDVYSTEIGEDHRAAMASFTLGKLLYIKKDYNAAIESLERTLNNSAIAPNAHRLLIKIYEQKNRTDQVDFHLEALGKLLGDANQNYIPTFVPHPNYPKGALRRQISGYAVIELTVTSVGSVRNLVLLEESPKDKGFGKAALKAARGLEYAPTLIDGKAQEVPGVLYKYNFRMDN